MADLEPHQRCDVVPAPDAVGAFGAHVIAELDRPQLDGAGDMGLAAGARLSPRSRQGPGIRQASGLGSSSALSKGRSCGSFRSKNLIIRREIAESISSGMLTFFVAHQYNTKICNAIIKQYEFIYLACERFPEISS
jgi:hypothetical protein